MDSSEPRRKRKRLLRQSTATATSISPLLSVRSFLLCLCFLLFVYLLSFKITIAPSSFRPVLVVSSFSLLSSSSSNGVESLRGVDRFLLPKIEGRVLFPDHILLLARKNGLPVREKLECVYFSRESEISAQVLSSDDYDQSRVIFRCPLPPGNSSAAVANLRKAGGKPNGKGRRNQTAAAVASWENVVYAAALDGDSAVVFVKGLNLRRDRESSSRRFSCHFWLGKKMKMKEEEDHRRVEVLQTRAVTAAQEVVRCPLPSSIKDSPEEALGGRVTIGMMMMAPRGRRVEEGRRFLFPSVAEVSRVESEGGGKKCGLCACTMVWNQAPALREWITYHAWLGVERWFIYDNNSDDAIEDVIYDPEMQNFNVTRHVWPWIKTQEAGFSHCALRAKSECDWVAFMDVDEFFYLPYASPRHRFRKPGYASQNALQDLVRNVSSSSSSRMLGEIRTACHSYGPSGLDRPPAQGVTVGYTCRVKSPERHKSIVRPDALDPTLLNVVHHFRLKDGYRFMDMPPGTAVINHYKYQVWEVFRAKFFRRVATYVADWTENQNEGSRDRAPGLGTEAIEPPNWHLQFCEVWDTGLRDFVLANFADSSTGFLPWETKTSLQYDQ